MHWRTARHPTSRAQAHTNRGTHGCSNRHKHSATHADYGVNTDLRPYAHAYIYTDAHAHTYADTHAHADTQADLVPHTHADRIVLAYTDT